MDDSNLELNQLIDLSHFFGQQKKYVIAGGGNTSFKNKHKLWIKASGQSMAQMDIKSLVCVSRALLDQMTGKEYQPDPRLRESEVTRDLLNAVLYPKDLRPSIEAPLHHLIDFAYVVHTHPTHINGLLCSMDGAQVIRSIFGDEVLYMSYANPGFELAQKMILELSTYKDRLGYRPNIILLQNHGVFVGANSPDAIRSFYSRMEDLVQEAVPVALPNIRTERIHSDKIESLHAFFDNMGYIAEGYTNELIRYYSVSRNRYNKISKPLTPDQIVYCSSAYPFLDAGIDPEEMGSILMEFRDHYGYFPKVTVIEGEGLVIADDQVAAIQTILEVFTESLRVIFLAEGLGGPRFMSDEQIEFIDGWESEHYRRKIARGDR